MRVALDTSVLVALAAAHPPEAVPLGDYQAAAGRCAEAGLRSGAIFDALHLVVAERVGAVALLTLNVKDYTRLSPRIRVLAPPGEVGLLPG